MKSSYRRSMRDWRLERLGKLGELRSEQDLNLSTWLLNCIYYGGQAPKLKYR